MMFNFYPWGLSVNIVKPLSLKLTKVEFRTYIWDENKLEIGAGSKLDKVEREDEYIVENVQKGVSSKFYKKGRFSLKWKGVHQFHRLVVILSLDLIFAILMPCVKNIVIIGLIRLKKQYGKYAIVDTPNTPE